MHIRMRTLSSATSAALLALVLAACGGGTATAPSATGAGTSGEGGATIVGTVRGGTAGSASPSAGLTGATAPSLTVTVVGTNLSTSVGAEDRFEFTGVPGGSIQLRFTGANVDAVVRIVNVGAEDLIQIGVVVSGSSASIVTEERSTGKVSLCHSEGNGSYHLINISVSAEPAHLAHGDAKVGEKVPAEPTKVFDEQCRPVGASIEIEKSTNGQDADHAPGPTVTVGGAVTWTYAVKNTGTVALTNVLVVDDRSVAVSCGGQTALAVGQSMTCSGAGVATLGQYRNVGTVTARWASGTVTDSDASHYLGVAPTEETGPKVQLCHRTGNGSYHLIEVSVNAEPAHRGHGDAKVGEAVPGAAGKTFGTGCVVK